MKLIQDLEAQARLVEHWASPDVNHCPDSAEAEETARLLRLAATRLHEQEKKNPENPVNPV